MNKNECSIRTRNVPEEHGIRHCRILNTQTASFECSKNIEEPRSFEPSKTIECCESSKTIEHVPCFEELEAVKSTYYIYQISSKCLNLNDVFLSRLNCISKIRWNYGNHKHNTVVKQIFASEDYIYTILETIYTKNKLDLHNKVVFWKNHAEIYTKNKNLFTNEHRYEVLGAIGERVAYGLIKNVFGGTLIQTKFKYTSFDFYNETYLFEYKNRQIYSFQYKTVIINKCKIGIDRNIIFIFQYIDKVFYIRFERELFDCFDIEFKKPLNDIFTRDDVIHIPIRFLTEFNSESKIILPAIYTDLTDIENRVKLIEEDENKYQLYNRTKPKMI